MRLKLFQASRMAEAMAQLRAELGEEAVILETRRTGRGVEITAALEAAEPLLILPAGPPPEAALPPALARHNLPPALAARLGHGPLPDRLAACLGFAPLPLAEARPLLLAGPAGA